MAPFSAAAVDVVVVNPYGQNAVVPSPYMQQIPSQQRPAQAVAGAAEPRGVVPQPPPPQAQDPFRDPRGRSAGEDADDAPAPVLTKEEIEDIVDTKMGKKPKAPAKPVEQEEEIDESAFGKVGGLGPMGGTGTVTEIPNYEP